MQYSELIIRILEIHIDSHYNPAFYSAQSKLELTKQAAPLTSIRIFIQYKVLNILNLLLNQIILF